MGIIERRGLVVLCATAQPGAFLVFDPNLLAYFYLYDPPLTYRLARDLEFLFGRPLPLVGQDGDGI